MDQTPKMRRGLFGYRRKDVAEALIERERELHDLRREVDTLWLAVGEHDRALRRSLEVPGPTPSARRFGPEQRTAAESSAAAEAPNGTEAGGPGYTGSFPIVGEPGLPAPGQAPLATQERAELAAEAANGAPGAGPTLERRRALAAELADLEAAMRAIEEATKALERATVEEADEASDDGPEDSD